MPTLNICLATRNAHKIQEISKDFEVKLTDLGKKVNILSLDDIHCKDELPETNPTIELNSWQKAKYIWENYQIHALSDDSGLEVEALNGEPGVHSAHYSGERDFGKNIAFLLEKLGSNANRKAQFKTVMTLILDGNIHQFTGIITGTILAKPKGLEGFGYDPIFLPDGYDKTFAQMSILEKNAISHRTRALAQVIDFLKKYH